MLKVLADRLAEAFAEHLHERVRREFWGYASDEQLSQRGADRRDVPRHPARARLSRLPGPHREGRALPRCSTPSSNAGMKLTESFAMLPAVGGVAASTSRIPESSYFAVGKIGRDQVEDYARRTGMSVAEAREVARALPRRTSPKRRRRYNSPHGKRRQAHAQGQDLQGQLRQEAPAARQEEEAEEADPLSFPRAVPTGRPSAFSLR